MTSDEPLPTTITLPSDWDLLVTFGQFKGMTIRQVIDDPLGPGWILWAFDNVEWFTTSKEVLARCQGIIDARRIAQEQYYYHGYGDLDRHWDFDDDDNDDW